MTSLNGGSSRGMGPKSSEYFWNHCSLRCGMSVGDMLGLVISPTAGDFVLIGLWAALDARNPRCGIGFCSRSEDTRDKSWLVASSSLDATHDCAGSTLVEPAISHQVAGALFLAVVRDVALIEWSSSYRHIFVLRRRTRLVCLRPS